MSVRPSSPPHRGPVVVCPTIARLFAGLLLLALTAGCGAAGPISGERLAELKRQVAIVKPGAVRITAVLPRALADGGPGALIVMPFLSYGDKVTEFELYDGYFKTAFVAADELSSLGLDARIDPALWQARSAAVAFGVRETTERELDVRLTALHAQEEIQALYRLGLTEKRGLFVSRSTLLAARTGLPPEVSARTKGKATAREIRDLYFLVDEKEARSLTLEIEALALETVAEQATAVDRRTGTARLRCTLRRRGNIVLSSEHSCAAESDGSGISIEKGNRYSVTFGGEDPLEQAIRGALRRFWEEALPELADRRSSADGT